MFALLFGLAAAQPFAVQGAVDDGAVGLDGTHSVTFRLYPASNTPIASAPWAEVDVVAFVGGSFQSWLGDGVAVPASLLEGPLWLGVTVDEGLESARVPVGWAPRAAFAAESGHAATADAVGGQSLAQLDDRYARLDASAAQTGSLNLTGSLRASEVFVGGTALSTTLGAYLPLAGGALSGALTLSGDPTQGAHAATRSWVESAISASSATRLPLTGGALTGALALSGDPTQPAHAATKSWVEASISASSASRLPLAGGALTGALTLSGAPTAPSHAATKAYVDGLVAAAAPAAPTCTSASIGAVRWASGSFEACGSLGWTAVFVAANGTSAANAARSCAALKATVPTAGDGIYWIAPPGYAAFQVYCNMTSHGGPSWA
jgi:hypothetical protein